MIVHYFLGGNRSRSRAHRSRSARKRATRRQIFALRPRCETMEDRTLLATMLWASAVNGDWDVASNWVNSASSTDHHVPLPTDDAQINISGITVTHTSNTSDLVNSLTVANGTTFSLSNGSLSIAAASTISGNLTMSGGTLSGAGNLTVDGQLTWSGGTMSGTGTTIANGTLALGTSGNAASNEPLVGRTLENFGTATVAYNPNYGGSGFYLASGATLNNEAGASFAFVSDTGVAVSTGDGTLVNAGTLSKTGGTGTSVVAVAITDSGTIEASSGTLSLSGGGTFSGAATLSAAAGADLDFEAGSFTTPSGSSITGSGTGTVSFTGATVTIAGTYSVAGQTYVSSGEVDFNSTASTGTLTQVGGTIGGSGSLTVAGLLSWYGGTMSGT